MNSDYFDFGKFREHLASFCEKGFFTFQEIWESEPRKNRSFIKLVDGAHAISLTGYDIFRNFFLENIGVSSKRVGILYYERGFWDCHSCSEPGSVGHYEAVKVMFNKDNFSHIPKSTICRGVAFSVKGGFSFYYRDKRSFLGRGDLSKLFPDNCIFSEKVISAGKD